MPMKIVYNVQVNTVYRTLGSNIDIKEDDEVNITTSGYDSMCGVTNMTVDERYLITGKTNWHRTIACQMSHFWGTNGS